MEILVVISVYIMRAFSESCLALGVIKAIKYSCNRSTVHTGSQAHTVYLVCSPFSIDSQILQSWLLLLINEIGSSFFQHECPSISDNCYVPWA